MGQTLVVAVRYSERHELDHLTCEPHLWSLQGAPVGVGEYDCVLVEDIGDSPTAARNTRFSECAFRAPSSTATDLTMSWNADSWCRKTGPQRETARCFPAGQLQMRALGNQMDNSGKIPTIRVSHRPPVAIRLAGAFTVIEGAIIATAWVTLNRRVAELSTRACVLVRNGPPLATVSAVAAGAVVATLLVAGWALLRGQCWPRSVVLTTQVLLLIASGVLLTVHEASVSAPLGTLAIIVSVLLASPAASRWMARPFDLSVMNVVSPTPETRAWHRSRW
ncbi:hypothetical protein K7711_45360 [Nocardia sp. CA2R105]|uniref:hypothetical protein n=1 Tax=Nocardia coffeae TaxID=2873381 RepID=UPI001CA640E5|nr:hypothetical protein [Nocardia coffeae]MBY8863760.1 hypothetical protein [Nocardia coffeae]